VRGTGNWNKVEGVRTKDERLRTKDLGRRAGGVGGSLATEVECRSYGCKFPVENDTFFFDRRAQQELDIPL
jgi:hypothetical protein